MSDKVYIVEYLADGGGTSRMTLGEYAPHFCHFETEDGQKLVLKKKLVFTCETCLSKVECMFSSGDNDYCHEHRMDMR